MKMKNIYLVTSVILLMRLPIVLKAQQPELVADINTTLSETVQSSGQVMRQAGGYIFFSHSGTSELRAELGVWDGTEFSSFDINPSGTSTLDNFTALGDKVYFTADDGTNGRELWEFNGTAINLIDINSGGASDPSDLVVFGSDLFFSADDGNSGRELWKYNGTNATLIDIVNGATGSNPEFMTVYNNELVFFADDGTVGNELWSYDGMTASLVEDIRDGSVGSHGSGKPYFEVHDGSLFFAANDGGGAKLWEYDGTDVTEIMVRDTPGASNPEFMTSFNSELYFTAFGGNLSTGDELWRYNGASSTLVEDIAPGMDNPNINPKTRNNKFLGVGGSLYFRADDGTNGSELYQYDGTTVSRVDVNPNSSDLSGNAFIDFISTANNNVYFQAYGGSDFGTELWEYDGNTLTQIEIRSGSESSSVRSMTELDGTLYFTANEGDGTSRWHLWKYDGVEAEPIRLTGLSESSEPNQLQAIGNQAFFVASTQEFGAELWRSDGTITEMVADINPGEDGSYPYSLTAIGSELFFFAEDQSAMGESLYVYDGSNFQTFELSGADGFPFVLFNDQIYFTASDGVNGQELWRYDGTNVSLAADINPAGSSRPAELTVFQDELVFAARDDTNGEELWKFDGTSASLLLDILPGASSSQPEMFAVVGSTLYCRASSSGTGRELVAYDGSTVTFIDVVPGATQSNPENLTAFNGNLVFTGVDPDDGEEVLVYDGTTVTSLDVNPGTTGSFPTQFLAYNGNLYFQARSDAAGRELFRYDGTNVTSIDIVPGTEGSNAGELFVNGPYLYFNAFEETGTTFGINRYDGINPPEFLAAVEKAEFEDQGPVFIRADNFVYFKGVQNDDIELWRIRAISEETDITTFSFSEQTGESTIDNDNHTVAIEVAFGTGLSNLTPSIEVSDFGSINPGTAISRDFSSSVNYTVTSEFGNTQDWTVDVTIAPNSNPVADDSTIDQLVEQALEGSAIDLTAIFSDSNGDQLTFTAVSDDEAVVIVTIDGNTLNITEVGSGTTTVTVTASDGNGGTVTIEFDVTVDDNGTITSVEDEIEQLISIYPNPTSDYLNFNLPQESNWTLHIYDQNGRLIQQAMEIEPASSINVSGWRSGLYYLKLYDETTFTTTKIVVD